MASSQWLHGRTGEESDPQRSIGPSLRMWMFRHYGRATSGGHYGFMAAFSITIIGVGSLASLRPDGWRLTAWVAGLLPALLGLVSLFYPVASSLSLPWALAVIAWGTGFVATAERSRHAEGPSTFSAAARTKSDQT